MAWNPDKESCELYRRCMYLDYVYLIKIYRSSGPHRYFGRRQRHTSEPNDATDYCGCVCMYNFWPVKLLGKLYVGCTMPANRLETGSVSRSVHVGFHSFNQSPAMPCRTTAVLVAACSSRTIATALVRHSMLMAEDGPFTFHEAFRTILTVAAE